jgi:hypothetical protein
MRDLEDQVKTKSTYKLIKINYLIFNNKKKVVSESQNKVADKLKMVLKDLKQIKQENEQLQSSTTKSKK